MLKFDGIAKERHGRHLLRLGEEVNFLGKGIGVPHLPFTWMEIGWDGRADCFLGGEIDTLWESGC
jgi:hypothetical protein